MQLNADFSQRAVIHAATLDWTPSPMPGVSRRMLDRIGNEVARATSIVRYDPGSAFSAHTHEGGEEFLVLDGVFQDEAGDFPTGSYVRNPPTSSHTPSSEPGCTILVKLRQFDPDDRTHVRIDAGKMPSIRPASRPDVALTPLFADERETVAIEDWDAGASIAEENPGGMEIFVLSGSFEESGERFSQHSWLRLPPGAPLSATVGADGARVWVKTGHLADIAIGA